MNYQQFMTYTPAMLQTMIDNRGRRANQRLRELEKQGLDIYNAYRWLERNAAKYEGIRHTKGGNIRFSLKSEGLNKQQLASRLAIIDGFLSAKTSTKRGINKSFRKSYESFMQSHPQSTLSFKGYTDIMESRNIESFKKQYYSAFRAMLSNSGKASGKTIKDIIESSEGDTLQDIEQRFRDAGGGEWQSGGNDDFFK